MESNLLLEQYSWYKKQQLAKKIIDGRLASYLGVDCFYMPRTSYSGDIPVVSFPYMHVCSNVKCGRIFDLRENFDLDRYLKFGVTCPECHRQAYPSRFITICENGHMDDFPWSWWVHGGNTTCKGMMRMYSTGNTSTLADMSQVLSDIKPHMTKKFMTAHCINEQDIQSISPIFLPRYKNV